jgi:hypothetical protein
MNSALLGAGTVTSLRSEAAPKVASEAPVLATDSAPVGVRTDRYSLVNVAVGVLAVIAVVAALDLAQAFFVPLLLGILASYALSPVVEWLKAIRVPRPAGAAALQAARDPEITLECVAHISLIETVASCVKPVLGYAQNSEIPCSWHSACQRCSSRIVAPLCHCAHSTATISPNARTRRPPALARAMSPVTRTRGQGKNG